MALAAHSFSDSVETKISVTAQSLKRLNFDKPCYLHFPEGDAIDRANLAGSAERIKRALEEKGYFIVDDLKEAKVIVKVDYLRVEPIDALVHYKARPRIDYSNASSTRNYAATTAGGRYEMLARPTYNRLRNAPESILGPNGEIIELWNQKPYAPEVIGGELKKARVSIHPLFLQIAAYHFDEMQLDLPPVELWRVNASHFNLRDEDTEAQLERLANVSVKHIGKSLAKAKHVRARK
ncbi:hypothetical protein VDG1235_3228 [Verrucomicrobiia bacterium DG1235]|nr:hypothetical protein VDG1235_3228 [Verrucomicrobiae bacterium DG1235]